MAARIFSTFSCRIFVFLYSLTRPVSVTNPRASKSVHTFWTVLFEISRAEVNRPLDGHAALPSRLANEASWMVTARRFTHACLLLRVSPGRRYALGGTSRMSIRHFMESGVFSFTSAVPF